MKIFTTNEFSLITRSILDRIPVLVAGTDIDEVDDVVECLSAIVPNRREMIFGTDFMTKDELDMILEHESRDYEHARTVIRAPVATNPHLLDKGFSMKSWITGYHLDLGEGGLFEEATRFKHAHGAALVIKLDPARKKTIFRGNGKEPDTSFEAKILKKLSSETERSLVRMQRVLDKKIKGSDDINDSVVKSLTDLSHEEALIKQSMFEKEILEFHHAARRALAILSRLAFLKQYQPVTISKKQFFDAIHYDKTSIPRLLQYIKAEWDEEYEGLVDNDWKFGIGDHLDSLWG